MSGGLVAKLRSTDVVTAGKDPRTARAWTLVDDKPLVVGLDAGAITIAPIDVWSPAKRDEQPIARDGSFRRGHGADGARTIDALAGRAKMAMDARVGENLCPGDVDGWVGSTQKPSGASRGRRPDAGGPNLVFRSNGSADYRTIRSKDDLDGRHLDTFSSHDTSSLSVQGRRGEIAGAVCRPCLPTPGKRAPRAVRRPSVAAKRAGRGQ